MVMWGAMNSYYVGYMYLAQGNASFTSWEPVFTFQGPDAAAQAAAMLSYLNGNSFASQRTAHNLMKGDI